MHRSWERREETLAGWDGVCLLYYLESREVLVSKYARSLAVVQPGRENHLIEVSVRATQP